MVGEGRVRDLGTLADRLDLAVVHMVASRVAYANLTACRLLGRSLDELTALPNGAAVVAPEDQASLTSLYLAGLTGETSAVRMLHVVDRAGSVIPAFAALTLSPDGAGGVDTVIVARDLRTEVAAAREHASLVELVDRVALGILVWDGSAAESPAALRLVSANLAARAVLGARHEIIGRRLHELFPDVDDGSADRLLSLCGTDGAADFGDVAYRMPDGSTSMFRWRAVGLSDKRVASTFDDVTRHRAAESARRELLRRLVESTDSANRRLAIDVHDDTIQQLAAAATLLEGLRRHPDSPARAERIASATDAIRRSMSGLRQLVFELTPPDVLHAGLSTSLRSVADHVFAETETLVDVAVEVDVDVGLPVEVQQSLFRIGVEGLTNARKHAGAEKVTVTVRRDLDRVSMEVVDDGAGFEAAPPPAGHVGLRSMRERAAALGGSCSIGPGPGGHGTIVRAVVPIDSPTHPQPAPIAAGIEGELDDLRSQLASVTAAARDARRDAWHAGTRLRRAMALMKVLGETDVTAAEIARAASELVGDGLGSGCAVHLLSDDGAVLRRAASWHADPQQLAALDLTSFADHDAGTGHARTVLVTRQPLLVPDVLALDATTRARAASYPSPVHSGMVVPLVVGDDVLGSLALVRDGASVPFDEEDLDFAVCAATHVALALQRAAPRGPAS